MIESNNLKIILL